MQLTMEQRYSSLSLNILYCRQYGGYLPEKSLWDFSDPLEIYSFDDTTTQMTVCRLLPHGRMSINGDDLNSPGGY